MKTLDSSRPTFHLAGQALAAGAPAPARSPERTAGFQRSDAFETRSGSGVALQRSAAVAPVTARAVDHGKLMRDYLTGATPPPADFAKVMGYEPVRAQMPYGTRMQDPFGTASAPYGIGPDDDFQPMAKTHDYGYDLLRYFDRKGQPLGPEARKAADKTFREDLFHHANAKPGLKDRWVSRTWAQIYATAVELNSRRQGYGPP